MLHLDVAAILNILSLGFCLISIIVLIFTMLYPFVAWIPVLVFIFLVFSETKQTGMLTLALVIFVQIKIHKNITNLAGPDFGSKGWSFYISYCALITGLLSIVFGIIFTTFSIVQHSKKGKRLNDKYRGSIPNAPELSGNLSTVSRENKSYTIDELPVYSDFDHVDLYKFSPDKETHLKMRAFYSGTISGQDDTEFNFNS